MKDLKFNPSGLTELSQDEMENHNGGFIFLLLGVASYVINTTLIVGTFAAVGASIYGAFEDGYTDAKSN